MPITKIQPLTLPGKRLVSHFSVGHYSVPKFVELHRYLHSTSAWRATATILVVPLPGLIAALIPVFLPMQPLRFGLEPAFVAHLFFIILFVSIGTMVPSVIVAEVPADVYSFREVIRVCLCCASIHTTVVYVLLTWLDVFPFPFLWVLGSSLWVCHMAIAHLVVLRTKCWHRPELLAAVKRYGTGLSLQVVQVVLYPAISVLFDHVDANSQIALTLLFPMVKHALRQAIKRATRSFKDQYGVVVVAGVEICASLYQSMIMQTAPSRLAMGIIMGIDIAQGLFSIKVMLDRESAVPRHELVMRAYAALATHRIQSVADLSMKNCAISLPAKTTKESERPTDTYDDEDYATFDWSEPQPILHATAGLTVVPQVQPKAKSKDQQQEPRLRTSADDGTRQLIRDALELTHAAESILLVEYFEVIVPIVNCVFLLVAARFRSAFYNTKLAAFYTHRAELSAAIASILLYSLLQGGSCVVMHFTMKRRYGISAGMHLAFVLERHGRAIAGQMVAWLPVILHFTSLHYGTDFSFQFKFRECEQW